MTNNIESIVAALFRTLAGAFERGTVTADAETDLYEYVRYWVSLGAARDKLLGRCEDLITRVRRRCHLSADRATAADRVSRELLERCAHHYAGLSALHRKR